MKTRSDLIVGWVLLVCILTARTSWGQSYTKTVDVVFGGKKFHYSLSSAQFPESQWDGLNEPPLSIGKAMEAARGGIKKIYGVGNRSIVSIQCDRFLSNKYYWYYTITFGGPQADGQSGLAVPLKVIVFLDGTILEPSQVTTL